MMNDMMNNMMGGMMWGIGLVWVLIAADILSLRRGFPWRLAAHQDAGA